MSLKHRLYKTVMGTSHYVPQLAGRIGHTIYPYMYEPYQLIKVCNLAEEASWGTSEPGAFVEAGCAYGATTVFLGRLMRAWPRRHPYIALDTFSGFVPEHVAHETMTRGKPKDLANDFVVNDQRWYDRDMKANGLDVRSIRCDVSTFDFTSLGPITFCLLDVDLYAPIKAALPNIVKQLQPGGLVVVDDCVPGIRFDGAHAAYQEFCAQTGRTPTIEVNRLGVIRA